MEFVNDMRKKGKLIMGIGHRVKSVRSHAHVQKKKKGKLLTGIGAHRGVISQGFS